MRDGVVLTPRKKFIFVFGLIFLTVLITQKNSINFVSLKFLGWTFDNVPISYLLVSIFSLGFFFVVFLQLFRGSKVK